MKIKIIKGGTERKNTQFRCIKILPEPRPGCRWSRAAYWTDRIFDNCSSPTWKDRKSRAAHVTRCRKPARCWVRYPSHGLNKFSSLFFIWPINGTLLLWYITALCICRGYPIGWLWIFRKFLELFEVNELCKKNQENKFARIIIRSNSKSEKGRLFSENFQSALFGKIGIDIPLYLSCKNALSRTRNGGRPNLDHGGFIGIAHQRICTIIWSKLQNSAMVFSIKPLLT